MYFSASSATGGTLVNCVTSMSIWEMPFCMES